ncbi:MAG: class I SAM-dependent methyltransferase [Mycobacterium sp.]|nr:class I SAM-dependent methyltransferase [Mycobacterium sp.]
MSWTTRALCPSRPAGSTVREVDLPGVLTFKLPVLQGHSQSRCPGVAVPADLRTNWPVRLVGAGIDRENPIAWLVRRVRATHPGCVRSHNYEAGCGWLVTAYKMLKSERSQDDSLWPE